MCDRTVEVVKTHALKQLKRFNWRSDVRESSRVGADKVQSAVQRANVTLHEISYLLNSVSSTSCSQRSPS